MPEVLAWKFEPHIVARHASRVYVYVENQVVRLTQGTVETFSIPGSSAIIGLDADPADALHLRAITKLGTVYESLDGAATWSQIGLITFFNEVRSVAFDPSDFDHILAGTKRDGVRVSRDGGKTWALAALPRLIVTEIVFSPADPHVVFADAYPGTIGVHGSLYRSNDGGRTFAHVAYSPNSLFYMQGVFAPHPRDTETFAAWDNPGLQVISPAGSKAWQFENVKLSIWSPAGTLYYLTQVNESR